MFYRKPVEERIAERRPLCLSPVQLTYGALDWRS